MSAVSGLRWVLHEPKEKRADCIRLRKNGPCLKGAVGTSDSMDNTDFSLGFSACLSGAVFYKSDFVKFPKLLTAALFALMLSPLAEADVPQAAHDVKETTVHIAKKTGEVAKDAAHATAHAAKAVAHGVASTAREGYDATKQAVHRATE